MAGLGIRLFTDEQIDPELARTLGRRGYDTGRREAGRIGSTPSCTSVRRSRAAGQPTSPSRFSSSYSRSMTNSFRSVW